MPSAMKIGPTISSDNAGEMRFALRRYAVKPRPANNIPSAAPNSINAMNWGRLTLFVRQFGQVKIRRILPVVSACPL